MTIRDLRQRWPEAEKALELESEIIITRDSVPVAKLVRIMPELKKRPRWEPEEHRKWQEKVFGKRVFNWVDKALAGSRADRPVFRKSSRAK